MTSLKIKVITIHELKKEIGKMLLFVSHIEFAFAIGKLLCIFIKYCLYLKRMFLFITWQSLSVKRLKAKKLLHMISFDFLFYIKNIIKMKLLFTVTNIIQSNC